LSLKQANDESAPVAEFDPTLYGMAAEYDEAGNYKYPEGFDPDTQEWLEGFDTQREKWEKQYAEAHTRWEAHKTQVEEATKADAEAAANPSPSTSYSSDSGSSSSSSDSDSGSSSSRPAVPESEGTLASDEALAALREKLTGN
jgi:small subunit ribosomal protein S1